MRAIAARALGEAGHPYARESLSAVLDDEEYEVRFWAAQSLAMLGDDEGLNLLLELLATTEAAQAEEKHAACRPERQMAATRLAAAIRAVGQLRHEPAMPHLVAQLGSRTAEVRLAAVEALAAILQDAATIAPTDELQALAKMDFPTIYQEPEQFLRFANICAEIVQLATQELARRERDESDAEQPAEELLLLTCSCGHDCQLSMKFVGRRVKCPKCGEVFAVPAPVE